MGIPRLVLATRNQGKIREFRRILDEIHSGSIDLLGLEHFPELEDVEETGETFLENALLKARTVCVETGLAAIADDSGLCIDALNGGPGIFSARWSGVHGNDLANMEKVLAQLDSVPHDGRRAHFTCVTAFVMPDGTETTAEGILQGHILNQPIGNSGFGYDPIFYLPDHGRTMAELPAEVKNRVSHRGRALQAARPLILEALRKAR